MIKDIKYGGFTANPNDHGSIEGDLAVAMNLIPEDGTIKPVFPPRRVADIPWDAYLGEGQEKRILCIHRTSAYTHYIVGIRYPGQYGTSHFWYLYAWDGTDTGQLTRIGGISYPDIYKVEPIGNTLVVLANDGIHYYLWKQGEYRHLGNHLPELNLQFELSDSKEYVSDVHKVDWELEGPDDWVDDEMTPISWFSDSEKLLDVGGSLRQAIMASLNEAVADACADKRFAFPLFVRYGYRLYDDTSVTMHSAPILLVPTLNAPALNMGWAGVSSDRKNVKHPAKVTASLTAYRIHCRPLDMSQVEELSNWSDIVSSVDVFVSTQFYTYNQGAKDREIVIDSALPQPPANTHLVSDIKDNGNFFLLKQIRLSKEMPQHNQLLRQGGDYVDFDFEPTNDNIVVRERMTDDAGTHDMLYADKSFAYNKRLNLAGVSKRFFVGFNPACMWRRVGNTTGITTTATVVIETDGREIVVQSPSGMVYYANRSSEKSLWFFYPNPAAKRAYLDINGDKIELELTQHPMLNGAYFCSLDEDAVQQSVDSIPAPSTDEERLVSMPNKVYTSQVDNPFFFPTVNSISSGNIMGICAAVRPMSSGQYGYADLYIFADNGIWTAEINDKGTYGNVTLATGDVCINPDSITQMETSVLFTTARGIMLISGSQAQCISEQIDDKGQVSPGLQEITTNLADMMSVLVEVDYFDTFMQGCRMLYDYKGQRIIVYNPDYSYAYIYSLESNKWGMTCSDILYTVNAYPDALAVTEGNKLVNYSEPCSVDDGIAAVEIGQLLLTRPLTLDQPDIIKTVTAVLQRGMFRKRMKHVQCVLYGSRDLYNWRVVSSSRDENIRGWGGTGYKWFRVGLLLHLERGESITGCTVQFEPRQTNRLR